MINYDHQQIKTLGQLKAAGYRSRPIKDEMRSNLIAQLKDKRRSFEGIIGFDDTVIPELQRAILSRHNIILLGLRGQAKTRIARLMINLLDEYIPVVGGSELNDDPLQPLSRHAVELIREKGDDTPVTWLHRSERYAEKLATPDVSIADLIGDLDPIKAAAQKLQYSDERVIHFGLIPRSHRSIFVINELPDLQARIQVALFNILQEKDIQIRGFKIRLLLDLAFVFTANPEDYTNRGSIVTPLKDRIESQIMTHYPKSIETARQITAQEARLSEEQKAVVTVPDLIKDLIEQISFEARDSEYVDANSGVSARLSISAYENLVSAAEQRALINGESKTTARISDLYAIIPSITGKVELVYEGEQEGPLKIAHILINKAIRRHFLDYFPNPEKLKRESEFNPYARIVNWFDEDRTIKFLTDYSEKDYEAALKEISGLTELTKKLYPKADHGERLLLMEFALHGLAEYSFLNKYPLESGIEFRDMMSSMFSESDEDDDDDIQELRGMM